ncbi:N-acetylmuramoyl-L-alanine amidase [Paenibacillus sabuli]|nr:N-acetylmuramoyl-L-alanine amidase [Paenibacillus sabuli]
MSLTIAIDDGHGMQTPGKRTPVLPSGEVMRENEFNRRVAALLEAHLTRCGFDTLLVAPTDADTPLAERTTVANRAGADLYVSVHANAFGAGGWNGVRGIETYHYAGSTAGARAARMLHRHLLAGTPLPDRGVRTANFYVLRHTAMPAVLVECGFMTNQADARLLMSETYRAECAEELARGICEYFGRPYAVPVPDPETANAAPVRLTVNGKAIDDALLIDSAAYVPLRAFGEALGLAVGWRNADKRATLDGRPVSGRLIDGVMYAPLRELGQTLGGRVGWDQASRTASYWD